MEVGLLKSYLMSHDSPRKKKGLYNNDHTTGPVELLRITGINLIMEQINVEYKPTTLTIFYLGSKLTIIAAAPSS